MASDYQWEKQYTEDPERSQIWKNIKARKTVIVAKPYNEDPYKFWVTSDDDLTKHLHDKNFNSMNKAVQYAESWMRSHPRG
jgi:hypothetical protein